MRTRMRRLGSLVVLSVGLATLVGCVWPRGPEDVRRQLARQAGVRLDREAGITVGPLGMALARWAVRHGGDEELTLEGVRRVEVGVYRVDGLRRGADARARLVPPGDEWRPVALVRDVGEEVMVLGAERDGELRRLLVIVAEPEEWTVVRLSGRLEPVLEQAVALALDEAGRL